MAIFFAERSKLTGSMCCKLLGGRDWRRQKNSDVLVMFDDSMSGSSVFVDFRSRKASAKGDVRRPYLVMLNVVGLNGFIEHERLYQRCLTIEEVEKRAE